MISKSFKCKSASFCAMALSALVFFNASCAGKKSSSGNAGLLLLPGIMTAQTSWYTFIGGSGDDIARSIQQTEEGGYIVAGEANADFSLDGETPLNPYSSLLDMVVLKLDSAGSVDWFTFIGGSGDDIAYQIQQTGDGGYIVAGESSADILTLEGKTPLNGYSDMRDMIVIKLTSAGAVDWYTFLGGVGVESAFSIEQTGDGGYIVAGTAAWDIPTLDGKTPLNSYNLDYDILIVKLDATGAVDWYTFLGDFGDDVASSIQETDDGYIIAGYTDWDIPTLGGKTPLNAYNDHDMIVIKLTSAGAVDWYTFLGDSGTNPIDHARCIQETVDGGYIVAGDARADIPTLEGKTPINGYSAIYDMLLIKIDSAGAVEWYTFIGGTGCEEAISVQQTRSGEYIITGYADTDIPTLQGKSPLNDHSGDQDLMVVKLNSAGSVAWYTFLGGIGEDVGRSIMQTGDGGFIVAGRAGANVPMLYGIAPLHEYIGGDDLFILKLRGDGTLHE